MSEHLIGRRTESVRQLDQTAPPKSERELPEMYVAPENAPYSSNHVMEQQVGDQSVAAHIEAHRKAHSTDADFNRLRQEYTAQGDLQNQQTPHAPQQ